MLICDRPCCQVDIFQVPTVSYSFFAGDTYKGLVLGHEICGEVIGLGDKIPTEGVGVKPGDVVVVYPWLGCRNCEACNAGFSSLCEENRSGTTDIGQGVVAGGYGSVVAVPELKYAVKLPVGIAPEIGCMLPCSALTAYNALIKATAALEKAVRMRRVGKLLIIGAGGLGFWNVILAKSIQSYGDTKITVADIQDKKLHEAKRLGADDVVLWNRGASVRDTVDQTTQGGPGKFDAVIDYVGQPQTSEVAVKSLSKGGVLVCVGLYGGQMKVSLPEVISNSITILGSRCGDLLSLKELVQVLSTLEIDRSNLPPIDVYRLGEVNEAHAKLRKGEILARALIKYGTD